MPSRYEKYTTHHTSRRTDGWDYTQPAAYFVTVCTQDRRCLFGVVEEGRMYLNALGQIVVGEWKRSEEIRDRVHLDAFVVMPNHLHGIVVFADPVVDAPTCPRNYRALGTTSSDDSNESPDESDPVKPSTGGATESTVSSNSGKASHGGSAGPTDASRSEKTASTRRSTPFDKTPDVHNEKSDLGGESNDDRPTGPAPRSLGSFVAGFKSAATKRINAHRDPPGAPVWQRNYHDVIIEDERHWRNARAYIRRNPADWDGDRLNRDRESGL
jgi:REP element-mobilizing transposase RayT